MSDIFKAQRVRLLPGRRRLQRNKDRPETLLVPDHEREWGAWKSWYRTVGQDRGIRFVPLFEVTDERYTVYFPVRDKGRKTEDQRRRIGNPGLKAAN